MIGTLNKIMDAWYELLNGKLTDVEVYRTNVPKSETGNYLLIRKESETEVPIHSAKWTKPVIIIEIVTKSPNSAEDETAGAIDDEVTRLLCPGTKAQLPAQSGIQISNVYKDSFHPIDDFDGVNYIYRHITRYRHDITQR